MYLNFQEAPKKSLFLSSLKQRKTSVVQPEQHLIQKKDKTSNIKTSSVTYFLQQKVSAINKKKIWRQIVPAKQQDQQKVNASVSVETIEELLSSPPTPPPKKSQTAPNLSIITDNELLMHRALPSLPVSPSVASSVSMSDKKSSVLKAKTWVGKSIQKWISNTAIATMTMEKEKNRKNASNQIAFGNREEQDLTASNCPKINASSNPMTLHCRILQVTNLTSSKSYEYTININVTNNPTQTHTGVMKKVAKGLSAAHPRAALSFNVQGQFELDCDLIVKPSAGSSSFVGRLISFRSKGDLDELSNKEAEDTMIRGKLSLDSGNDPLSSFANKGIGRYSIQTSSSVTLELTIAFWLEEVSEDIPKEDEQRMLTPIDQDILRYCQSGDYLTFYVKGETHPTWNRYWVSYEKNHLVLRLNERGGEPVDKITLEKLNQVETNPSDDIKEEIYLGKKYTIVLTTGKSNIYLFCDNYKSLRYWKCLFEHIISSTSDKNNANYDKSMHTRYLWPTSVQ